MTGFESEYTIILPLPELHSTEYMVPAAGILYPLFANHVGPKTGGAVRRSGIRKAVQGSHLRIEHSFRLGISYKSLLV
jgi:hypothetical protein